MSAPIPTLQSEADFQRAVIDLARLHKWTRIMHQRPAMNRRGQWSTPIQGDPGFVDLLLVSHRGIVFAELKVGKATPTKEQRAWLDALAEVAGVDCSTIGVYCWTPEDWPEIETVLEHGPQAQYGWSSK